MLSFPPDNFRRPAALARFLITALAGLALDQWTKILAFEKLSTSDRVGYQFIPGWLHFKVMTNRGAVFGMGEGYLILFVAVSVAAIVFLFYLFANSGRQRIYQLVLGMLMAGVLGNLYDRLRFGYVRDMINALPQWENLFPYIFNVADVLLCTGVALMVIHSLFQKEHAPSQPAQPQVDQVDT